MNYIARNWQQAHCKIIDAEYSLKLAAQLTGWLIKNDINRASKLSHVTHRGMEITPNEFELVNINHQRDERMGMVDAYTEKYKTLEKQIGMYDKAK